MIDLSTTYMGLELRNPLVCSSSPLTEHIDQIKRMEDKGAAAIVLPSLFEEQIVRQSHDLDQFLSIGESYAESITYFPDMTDYNLGPDGYLKLLRKAKQSVEIPVIGSLNGSSRGGWVQYAREMERAGADALELNIYYIPTNPDLTGADVEQMYVDLVTDVRREVKIPIAVKIGPYFSAMANMAKRLDEAGANGLVLFNRFYQPDFDLESLDVRPHLELSHSFETLPRLHWIAILSGHIRCDLALTGGVHLPHDVLKAMMAGAKVAMTTSALLKHGVHHLENLLMGITEWMEQHEYHSIRQMQGSMNYLAVSDSSAFERGNYLKVLRSHALKKTW